MKNQKKREIFDFTLLHVVFLFTSNERLQGEKFHMKVYVLVKTY